MSDEARAVFKFRRIASDREGYYYDRWDRAVPVNVIAANEQEAQASVFALSGEPPRGHFWKIELDGIEMLAARLEGS